MKTRRAHSPLARRQRNAPPPPPVLLDEIIMEILSWLPVKLLLQFRCVCKSWKSLISDPKFVKLHLRRSPSNANLLLLWERVSHDFEDSDLNAVPCPVRSVLENPSSTIAGDDCYRLEDKNCYYVVGSCNGLICLLGFIIGNTFKEYWFCLRNPATRLRSEKLARFRVDHNRTTTRFAFGYDNLSDTYKVVAFHLDIEANDEAHKTHVKVYSLGDNCWRNIQSFPAVPFVVTHVPAHNDDGVYLSGTLNWLALNFISDDYKWNNTITIDQLVIVSLDLGLETYTQLLLPRGLDEAPRVEPTLGVLVECLCFCHDYKRTHFVVWQMKQFGVEKSWTQFVKVSFQYLQVDWLDFFPFPLLLLWMSENGDILIMARAGDLQAVLYNRRDNRVERTQLPKYIRWADTKDYIESLVSPYCN